MLYYIILISKTWRYFPPFTGMLALIFILGGIAGCQPRASEVYYPNKIGQVPKIYDNVTLPVGIYLLSFESLPDLNSRLDNRQAQNLMEEVNLIWAKAGIRWHIEFIKYKYINARIVSRLDGRRAFREGVERVADTIDTDTRGYNIWKVGIIHKLPISASGYYARKKGMVFYGEINKNGERLPVVLAHELGHSLGLDHVNDPNNLMYGGKGKDPSKMKNLEAWQIAIVKRHIMSKAKPDTRKKNMNLGQRKVRRIPQNDGIPYSRKRKLRKRREWGGYINSPRY